MRRSVCVSFAIWAMEGLDMCEGNLRGEMAICIISMELEMFRQACVNTVNQSEWGDPICYRPGRMDRRTSVTGDLGSGV